MVAVKFTQRDDGQVEAHLGQDRPVFNNALADSVSSLPPRGEWCNGPSTYWIDQAEEGALRAHAAGDNHPFLHGNFTTLAVRGDRVVAQYDYAEQGEPGEALPLGDFLEVLAEWRQKVEASAKTATGPLPGTYRRNPVGPGPHLFTWVEQLCGLPEAFKAGGRSVRQLLAACEPPRLDEADAIVHITTYLTRFPELVRLWQNYSYDKRSSRGPYLDGKEVGFFDRTRHDIERYDQAVDACARFIAREAIWVLEGRWKG